MLYRHLEGTTIFQGANVPERQIAALDASGSDVGEPGLPTAGRGERIGIG
jgi:hypothetical protein